MARSNKFKLSKPIERNQLFQKSPFSPPKKTLEKKKTKFAPKKLVNQPFPQVFLKKEKPHTNYKQNKFPPKTKFQTLENISFFLNPKGFWGAQKIPVPKTYQVKPFFSPPRLKVSPA